MDKLLSVVNKFNTVPVAPLVEENYDQHLFEKFMQQIPDVWSYGNRSQGDFISLADDEKKAIVAQDYNDMKL